ncbi:hypothetical protein ACFWIA_23610 [Streptomyces sp. NPDC127068]|uniref:hypothetical protein n=1 Tax=Streptomyces sp. NPDC127068 TaxID=3347127 RepID=UPI0036544D81
MLAVVVATVSVGCGGSGQPPLGPEHVTDRERAADRERADERPERYRLVMPDRVVQKRYEREYDVSSPDETLAELMEGQVDGAEPVFGVYKPAGRGEFSGGTITVTGVYGVVLSPVTARDELLDVLDRRDLVQRVVAAPRTITPPGSAEPLLCRVVERGYEGDEYTSLRASCTWAEASTVVTVATAAETPPSRSELDAFAAVAGAMRDDVRVGY